MYVDIIILSHAKTDELRALTQQTIDSCIASEPDIEFNILVIEQAEGAHYKNALKIVTAEPFNYNRFMNIGIGMTSSEYVCLCNNDLLFDKGWCTTLLHTMRHYKLLSACPRCPDATRIKQGVSFGYNNSQQMSGWCIMTDRKLYDIIGKIDEDFPFWFADNAYAEQLKIHKVAHALVADSVVRHLGSSTLNTLEAAMQHEYTRAYVKRFYTKYPRNESARFFKKQADAQARSSE